MKHAVEKGVAKWVAILTRRQKKEDRKKPVTYKVSDIIEKEASFRTEHRLEFPFNLLDFEQKAKMRDRLNKYFE